MQRFTFPQLFSNRAASCDLVGFPVRLDQDRAHFVGAVGCDAVLVEPGNNIFVRMTVIVPTSARDDCNFWTDGSNKRFRAACFASMMTGFEQIAGSKAFRDKALLDWMFSVASEKS